MLPMRGRFLFYKNASGREFCPKEQPEQNRILSVQFGGSPPRGRSFFFLKVKHLQSLLQELEPPSYFCRLWLLSNGVC